MNSSKNNTKTNINIESKRIIARAIDPVHIGAGGYRLGRVDNTIVRDPITDIPKIPGTSLAGVFRAYYTLKQSASKSISTEKLFGNENQKGLLSFFDAQILFFPVSSIKGTIWITTKEILREFGIDNENNIDISQNDENNILKIIRENNNDNDRKPVNAGWLLLPRGDDVKIKNLPNTITTWTKGNLWIVSEKLFSYIVNDNLEVRTSVKIDPKTGTSQDAALFTYEAIPRGTIFIFNIVANKTYANLQNSPKSLIENIIDDEMKNYFRLLGIGGMGTRGFGRIEIELYD